MQITRSNIVLKPDAKRVLLRSLDLNNQQRIAKIVGRVLDLTDEEVKTEVNKTLSLFGGRHKNIERHLQKRYDEVARSIDSGNIFSKESKILIGSYFCMEYSLESAALFNPSMVWHPDQSGMPRGSRRLILALRATGEGHISSIEFRTGMVGEDGSVNMDIAGRFVSGPASFSNSNEERETEITFLPESLLSERVIFPVTSSECNGIEDARFVQFEQENSTTTYYATYTAYDGHAIHSRLLQTDDFVKFRINTIQGSEGQNKGMALFPRKIGGRYAMISRQDNENLFIMFSEDIARWEEKQLLLEPACPWEFIQIGNCGSPIETEEGWLLLTHGVGSMRHYTIGAILLDLQNPARVIGRLAAPILSPDKNERDGYVPNVVYSCGSQIHHGKLIIPYAMSDVTSSFAIVDVDELLSELTASG